MRLPLLLDAASWALILAGGFFSVVGGIGLLRMPDFYSRSHAGGVTDTLGAGLILAGLTLQALEEGWALVAVKLVMIVVFYAVSGPTAVHALVKAAYSGGLRVESPEASEGEGA